jgi:hypothetical protein
MRTWQYQIVSLRLDWQYSAEPEFLRDTLSAPKSGDITTAQVKTQTDGWYCQVLKPMRRLSAAPLKFSRSRSRFAYPLCAEIVPHHQRLHNDERRRYGERAETCECDRPSELPHSPKRADGQYRDCHWRDEVTSLHSIDHC